jgi:hypothetical protein
LQEINKYISDVNAKLQILLKQYNVLLLENSRQKDMINKLEQTLGQQKVKIKELEQEQLILKASLDKMDENEKKKLEGKINGYLRNIDKCISLLSHKQNR